MRDSSSIARPRSSPRAAIPSVSARSILMAAAFGAALLMPALLPGQAPMSSTPVQPAISAMGHGSVSVAPDRAQLVFAVETRGATASVASRENATLQQRVIAALRAAGIAERDITTAGYSVNPDYQFNPQTQEPRIVGYVARNAVQVLVRDIAKVGTLIDTAIEAGANSVGSLDFMSSRAEEVRREALQLAVQRACEDAQVMARAAGGSLGQLIELSASNTRMPPRPSGAMMRMDAAEASTPIQQGELAVEAMVSARWAFSPTPAPARECR